MGPVEGGDCTAKLDWVGGEDDVKVDVEGEADEPELVAGADFGSTCSMSILIH
jgi:hypothetical protein